MGLWTPPPCRRILVAKSLGNNEAATRKSAMSLGFSTFYAALIASALLCAGSVAQAFTIENGDGGATSSNLMAPSPFNGPKKDTDKDGTTRTQFGNTTIIMGPSTSSSIERDYQTGINRMFSPLGRPGN
jgi:hypothetical protein